MKICLLIFRPVSGKTDLGWFPLEWAPHKSSFCEKLLRDMLMTELSLDCERFCRIVGQEQAKLQCLSLMRKAVMNIKNKGPPLPLKEFNMVFLGEPGTGKTLASLLYLSGVLEIGHCVTTTGSTLGEGANSEDSASQYVSESTWWSSLY